jgi:predicted GNAT superfamily acetyltransferase
MTGKTMPPDIHIEPLTTHDDLRACEDIQRETWKMPETDIVPMHMLVAIRMHGGIILGARDGDQLLGFLFGYVGMLEPGDARIRWLGSPFFHASQMLGVLPGYQDQGIGYALKVKQREVALAQGLDLMTWTFDPLLSRNARFNLSRLGVVSRHYLRNLYDELPGINAGLPTDRLEVEWWLRGRRAETCAGGEWTPLSPSVWRKAGAPVTNPTGETRGGFRAPPDSFRLPDAAHFLVEIPGDFDALKSADMPLARGWRMHVRAVLEEAFMGGCAIVRFATAVEDGVRRSYYVLERDPDMIDITGGEE